MTHHYPPPPKAALCVPDVCIACLLRSPSTPAHIDRVAFPTAADQTLASHGMGAHGNPASRQAQPLVGQQQQAVPPPPPHLLAGITVAGAMPSEGAPAGGPPQVHVPHPRRLSKVASSGGNAAAGPSQPGTPTAAGSAGPLRGPRGRARKPSTLKEVRAPSLLGGGDQNSCS